MKANELRIGNWIHDNVEQIRLTRKDLIHLLESDNEHKAEPLILTKEWLLKFGFENKSDVSGYYFTKEKHRVYLFPDGNFEFEFNYNDNKRVNLFKIFQHVHQLQNLYYALTNQELEIK